MMHESKRPITVEDLLRLKRAELPPTEFWNQFDRELRAKQLAALVAKRPWWQRLPAAFSSLSNYRIPLGAAALVAITVVTFRESGPAGEVQPVADASGTLDAVASASSGFATAVDSAPRAAAAVEIPAEPRPSVVAVAAHPEDVSAAPGLATDATVLGELSQFIPLFGASVVEHASEPSPSARYIAANLAAVQAIEPVVNHSLLGTAQRMDGRNASARPAVEPLQQITSPSETRRARYMNALVARASYESSPHPTERVASRIAEERLYDRVSRFGAKGNELKLKF